MNRNNAKHFLPLAAFILSAAAIGHNAQAQVASPSAPAPQPAAPAAPAPSIIPPMHVIGAPPAPAPAPKKKHHRHHCRKGADGSSAGKCHSH